VGLADGRASSRADQNPLSRTETESTSTTPLATADSGVAQKTTAARLAQAGSDLLQFAVASGIAAVAAYAIWTQLPDELDVRTDIVGYPIHSNFNSNRYFWLYWLIAGFVPVVSLALFLLLRRIVPRSETGRRPRPLAPAAEPDPPPLSGWMITAVGVGRVAFVGAIFGLEIAVWKSEGSGWILPIGIPVMFGYAAILYLATFLIERFAQLETSFWDRLALANAFAVPFCVAGLYGVSRSTEVTVASSGRVHEYPWFPLWVAAGLTAAALLWVIRTLRLARVASALRTLERRLLLIVAGPVVLFLFVALLPGSWSGIDFFHEGELLAGARLMEEGAFPWRDLIFIHGLLTDAGLQLVGFNVFEDSRWGYVAGTLVVVLPIYWISLYYLCAYLFHRNWLFLVGTQLAAILALVVEGQLRFILMPLVLVLLGALLSKPSRMRAALFMSVLVLQAIVTPEAGIAALAVLLTIVAFEAYYYDRGKSFRENFQRTLSCAAVGALLTASWVAFLLAFGALDDFVFANATFVSDHHLTGATPVPWADADDRYRFAAVAPVVVIVLAFWYFAVQILRRAPLRVADWIMGAAALFVALYYQKFLARSDHVFQPYAVAVPIIFYTVYRLIEAAEVGFAHLRSRFGVRSPIRHPITALAVLVLIVQAPLTIPDVVQDVPGRLDARASEEPRTRQVGFIEAPERYAEILGDVDSVLRTNLGPGDELFDFTNSPALFHYLLERQPATRYYHASMAIREETQEDLVEELERTRPKLVVFSSGSIGLPEWDGISNQVRHYLVSRYLLDNYQPLIMQEGFVFMSRKGGPAMPTARPGRSDVRDLYFRTYPCDWGYAPNFLTVGPTASSSARPLSLTPRALGPLLSVSGWAVDPKTRSPAAKVVAVVDGRAVAEVAPATHRPDIAAHKGDVSFLASGFTAVLTPGSISRQDVQAVRIYGVSRSGEATELGYPEGSAVGVGRTPDPERLRLGERHIPIVPDAVEGFADSSSLVTQIVALDIPRGIRRSAYDWLEVETRSPLQVNGFAITDGKTGGDRGIVFRTLARGEKTVRVQVGACSQWHGYRSRRIYLRLDRPQKIAAIRLYR
jgi:hypothetical protein